MTNANTEFIEGVLVESEPLIHAKLAHALHLMQGVSKDGYNSAQKFHFRGIDQIAAASKHVFEQLDIFVAPTMRYVPDVPQPDKGHRVIIEATYTFYAEDGSSVVSRTIGEGVDSYDKATNKAMSAAFKYALMQVLCIGDPEDDADGQSAPAQEASPAPARAAAPRTPPPVSADEWNAWLAKRQRLLADPERKAQLVAWIDGSTIKVDRAMSVADFTDLVVKADELLTPPADTLPLGDDVQ